MKDLKVIGRIVFAIPLAMFGLNHFLNAGAMAGMVPAFIPGGVFWVYVTGLALLAAAVSLLTTRYIVEASVLLAALLGVFILTVHIPAMVGGNQMVMASLLKDLGLAGGALVIAGVHRTEV